MLSTPHGTLGTQDALSDVSLPQVDLSTPHGTLGTVYADNGV